MKPILFCLSKAITILLTVGFALMALASQWGLTVLKEPVDFEMLLEQEPENGMYVKGDVIFAYDCFASEESYTERSDGKKVGLEVEKEYYILPAEGELPFIVLESFGTDSKKMSTLSDETWDYMYGGAEPTTRVSVEGCVGELDPEIKEYMNEYLIEVWEYTEDELAEASILMIQQPKSISSLISIFWIGVACVLIAVVWFVIKMLICLRDKKETSENVQGLGRKLSEAGANKLRIYIETIARLAVLIGFWYFVFDGGKDFTDIFLLVICVISFLAIGLYPLFHLPEKMEFYEKGVAYHGLAYLWSDMGDVKFHDLSWGIIQFTSMITSKRKFDTTYLDNAERQYDRAYLNQ